MATLQQFRLPDVGEGLTEGEILSWYVGVGDTVVVNQTIVEVETAKAAVELPCPYAGRVVALHAQAGETVDVGTPIITIDTDPDASEGAPPTAQPAAEVAPPPAPLGPSTSEPSTSEPSTSEPSTSEPSTSEPSTSEPSTSEPSTSEPSTSEPVPQEQALTPPEAEFVPSGHKREAVLVGYGVREASVKRRPRRPAGGSSRPVQPTRHGGLEMGRAAEAAAARQPVRAKPPVRKLAKDLGVDLSTLRATGPEGTVTREDVLAAQSAAADVAAATVVEGTVSHVEPSAVVFVDGERREAVRGVRKHMADAMVRSAFTAPHVTEWVDVDTTRSVKLLRRLRSTPGFTESRVTPLLLVARAVLLSLRRTPDLNASFDAETQEVVYHDHVNLGVAAATPRGLLVPNVKHAQTYSLPELASALDDLVVTAREGRSTPADLAGGTFTITNVGVFGVDGGTPIINPGEGAILCVGAFRERPWVHKHKVKPRIVTQLTVSFDHRHIDGAMGSRFLADVAAILEDPAAALSW